MPTACRYDEIRYLECKLILKPNHFTSRQSLFDFAKVLRRPAKATGVLFDPVTFTERPLAIREVLFVDTHDFRLYNNAFILRRRIPYQDGFPIGAPEIVFKYRHTDPQKTAELDMRPHINGDYRIKFKAEALPLKDGLGGMRMLYSHNVEFHLESAIMSDRMSMERIAQALPALQAIPWEKDERAELVGGMIVEEVLQDIGVLDFGNRMRGDVQRRAVAQPRRPLAADRRVRLPAQVPPPRGPDRRGAGPLRGVLPRAAGRGARLDPARRHQDRRGLPAEGQPAARPRMSVRYPRAASRRRT